MTEIGVFRGEERRAASTAATEEEATAAVVVIGKNHYEEERTGRTLQSPPPQSSSVLPVRTLFPSLARLSLQRSADERAGAGKRGRASAESLNGKP